MALQCVFTSVSYSRFLPPHHPAASPCRRRTSSRRGRGSGSSTFRSAPKPFRSVTWPMPYSSCCTSTPIARPVSGASGIVGRSSVAFFGGMNGRAPVSAQSRRRGADLRPPLVRGGARVVPRPSTGRCAPRRRAAVRPGTCSASRSSPARGTRAAGRGDRYSSFFARVMPTKQSRRSSSTSSSLRQAPLVRQQALLDRQHVDDRELQPLRRVQRHHRDAILPARPSRPRRWPA